MKHLTSVVLTLLALIYIWLAFLASARVITNKWDTEWDVETLNKQLHDPSKERIDLDCDACKIIVDAIQFLARLNASEDEVAAVATWLCINLNIEVSYICQQGVQEFKTEALYVFTAVALGPEEICGTLIGGDCGHPYNPNEQNWTVTLPDTPKPSPHNQSVPKPDVPLIKILHLSDIHIDLEYTVGLNAECGAPLCCRPPNNTTRPVAGYWGDEGCDLPLATANSLFEYLADHKDEFDWIYWTGDLPAHNVWSQTRSDQLQMLHLLTLQLTKYLGDKQVYPTLGNHESSPVNSFPPPWITGENSNQWLLDAYQVDFSHWLPSSTSSTIKKGGFYAVKVTPGLKLISLNMNYCSSGNWWLLINSTDPAGQLQWMAQELQASEDAGEKVHIIGHIPPGHCMNPWSKNYYKIVNRYEGTIAGQFFGHTHEDEFEIFYDNDDPSKAINVVYIGPSVTTYQSNHPGFHVYDMEGVHSNTTFQLVDQHGYFFNLTTANSENKPAWEYLYGAKESYGMKSLQPQEWSNFVDRMETNDTLFELFMEHYYRRDDINWNIDKKSVLCSLRTAQAGDHSHCDDITEAYRYYYNHKSC